MRFRDTNGDSVTTMHKRSRARLIEHLNNASASVPDQKHAVHHHLTKAAAEIGAIPDNQPHSDENLPGGTIDRDLDARRLGAPQAEGSSEIASRAAGQAQDLFKSLARGERATFEKRRDAAVTELYKRAAKSSDKQEQTLLEKIAYELDRIDGREIEKAVGDFSKSGPVSAVNGRRRGWAERHGFSA